MRERGEAAQALAEQELAARGEEQRLRVVARAVLRLGNRSLAKGLAAWAYGVGEGRRLRGRARQVMWTWTRGMVGSAVRTWRGYAEERKRLRRAGSKVVARWVHGTE